MVPELPAVPIFKPEPAGANEFPCIVSYDDSNGGMSGTPYHSRISDGQPGLPGVFLSSHPRSAFADQPAARLAELLAVRPNSLAV